MKHRFLLLLIMVSLLMLSISVCADTPDADGEMVQKAIELIKSAWQEQADQYPEIMPSPYVDIKNTRIIRLTDHPVDAQSGKEIEGLGGVDCIIEFMMLTNYFGDTYPCNAGICDTVAVYDNGEMAVKKTNLLTSVRARYYISDFSGVIEEIIDLGSAYNGLLF